MKLRFLGEMQPYSSTAGGCASCGGGTSLTRSGLVRVPRKTVILDSLATLDVVVGQVVDVSVEDGQGLLELTTEVNGNVYSIFEVV